MKLSTDRARIRRKIMHRITRQVPEPLFPEYEQHYKDIIQEAITMVLFDDMMEEILNKGNQ